MKKFVFITCIALLSLWSINVNAQEAIPEQMVQERREDPKPPGTATQTPPAIDAAKPTPTPEVKRIAPNQREGAARRLQARPPRERRPEIIRPGGETRPAGTGRPRGFRRPAR